MSIFFFFFCLKIHPFLAPKGSLGLFGYPVRGYARGLVLFHLILIVVIYNASAVIDVSEINFRVFLCFEKRLRKFMLNRG